MIKRLCIAALLVFTTSLLSFADEQKEITLNDDNHRKETIELGYGNLFVSLKNADNDGNTEIKIELENTHESNTLLLFDRTYNEKTLKKMFPSIRYDKVFGGSKGERYIDICPEIKSTIRIKPSFKKELFVKTGIVNAPIVCKLPIYLAKNKNKSGSTMLLMARDVIELKIQVQVRSDEKFISITEAYNALIKEIDSDIFCSNKNHKGEALIIKKSKYREKINNLKKEIYKIRDERGYFLSDKSYKKYMELSNKIDSISIEERIVDSCPNDVIKTHRVQTHSCKHCGLSYEQIYKKLENHFIDIHNGKKTKAQVMSDVESLYSCVSKNKKRSAKKSIKYGITRYYNKIKSL